MKKKKNKINKAVAFRVLSSLSFKNKKSFVSFALVFFILASMFLINVVNAQPATTGTFCVVQSGTGGTTNITSVNVPSSPNPVGATLKFDIYVSGANDIWGWLIPNVTWNPKVLQLTKVVEGSFLADNTGAASTNFIGGVSTFWDNTNGDIKGGLAEAISSSALSKSASGVVATLTFTVSGYGNSPVIINGGYLLAAAAMGTPKINVPCNSASVEVLSTETSISIYQSGTTTDANVQWPSLQDPIGGKFSIDLYVTSAEGTWGWNVGVTWDPNVIKCTSVTEGSYLSQSGKTAFAPGFIDNYLGKIDSGLSDSFTGTMGASASSGVLATLNFTISTYGDSNIGLVPGTVSTLLNDANPHQAITPVQLNKATYSWTPAQPADPQAVIITEAGPLGAGSDQTLINFPLILNGSQSLPGTNMVPPYQNCPITTFSWSITLTNGTKVASSAPAVSLSAADVGSATGTIVATLTVVAPSPTNTPAPAYSETGTTTLSIQVVQTSSILDIWTQNGGQGLGANCTSFGPEQLVDLIGYVTFNNAPVVGKEVTFDIYSNGQYIDYAEATTNMTGYATTSYRFPWQGNNPQAYFGVITVSGSVDLSQVKLTDTCQFYYGYQLNLQSVTINNGIFDTNGIGPVFFKNYAGLNAITLTATVNSTNWIPTPFYLTATILDTEQVPVACEVLSETAPAAQNTPAGSNTQAYTMSLTIPTWAFDGPATVCVDILNGTPADNGVAFSPQQSASIYIYNGS